MAIAEVQRILDASPPVEDARQMRNAIIASLLGWSLDLFDLFILLICRAGRRRAVLPVQRPDAFAGSGLCLVCRDAC